MRRGILIAALLALAALPGQAQEEPEARRRVVYVPQDQMDVLVGKHGKGVLLDVEEYLKLRREAEKRGVKGTTKPASGAVVLSGRITAEVNEKRAVLPPTTSFASSRRGFSACASP